MSRLQKALIVRLGLLVVLVLSGCMPFVRIDVTGLWDGQLQWTDGPAAGLVSPVRLDLVHQDQRIEGIVMLMGPASRTFDLPITTGRTRSRSIGVKASGVNPWITPSVAVSLELDGDYDDTGMSGTGSQTVNGNEYHFTWQTTRVSAPPETGSF